MPNPRPIAAFLNEATEAERDFGYNLIDRFVEAGYDLRSSIYWKERVKSRQIQDARKFAEELTEDSR
jgi:hypothetical protein